MACSPPVKSIEARKNLKFLACYNEGNSREGENTVNYNLMGIKYFVDVVQEQSFSAAGKRNYVSETAISKAIKKLEGEVGSRLLNRSNRANGHVTTTKAGQSFYDQAVRILTEYENLWSPAKRDEKTPLRIRYIEGFGEMEPLVDRLGDHYQLSFAKQDLLTSVPELLRGDYDLLVTIDLPFVNNNQLTYVRLASLPFRLLFNKDELAAAGGDDRKLAASSVLYVQRWQTTAFPSTLHRMMAFGDEVGYHFARTEMIEDYQAAMLTVNYSGGIAVVPETVSLPANLDNLVQSPPKLLKEKSYLVALMAKGRHEGVLNRLNNGNEN